MARHGDVPGSALLTEGSLGLVDGRENFDGPIVERPAAVGQPDLAARAVEDRPAQLALELDDLLAQRGLRDEALFGGPREILELGHRHEVAELMQFHSRCLSR